MSPATTLSTNLARTLSQTVARHPRRALRFDFPTESSEATRLAAANFERNRGALERTWPRAVLALPESLPELEWLFARDGALSARHVDQRWFNDISVPRRAAQRMIKQLAIVGRTAVMLAPTHACQVRRALELLASTDALIVVIPGESNAGVIAACEDFSADLIAGRLWLAIGPDWQEELKAILEGNDGLTPPQTMIRVPGLNASVVELISRPADALLSRHAAAQRQLVSMQQSKRCSPQRPVRRACVVTSGFALWNDAGQLLGELAQHGSVECVTINNSSPTQASDLRLARAADGCDMVITANVGRADRPGTVANEVPWITWVTGTTVPARVASAPDDRLILADATLQIAATHAGWPDASVSIAREPWHERPAPELPCDSKPHGRAARATQSIIVDLPAITLPPAIDEMSSLRLVWELIERELTGCALRERGTVESFILKCADQVGVPREGFPIATFRDGLVLPLFARELALELALHGIDFTIHGHGWDNFPTLASRWRGPVTSAETFAACLRSSSAILDVHPGVSTHPSRRTGLPLLSPWGRPLKNAMTRLPPSGRVAGALTMSTILNAL